MSGANRPRVSLVVTVLNEAATIGDLLQSISRQHRWPDEVIIVDGGSTDGTLERIRAFRAPFPLELISAPGANIAAGRNLALARARGDVVAITDAGVRLEPDWLSELLTPFERELDRQPDVVAGFFRADPRGLFETALAATTLPDEDEIAPDRFLPSSRSVAVRRSLIEAGICYPSWLDYGEDLIFDLRLKRAGARFEFRPQALVWFRPRHDAAAYWRQYYRYARGDGKAGLFARRHLARYLTYVVAVPLVLLRPTPGRLLLASIAGLAYMRRPWRRLWRRRAAIGTRAWMLATLLAPGLRLVGDLAKMTGYPAGLLWRARRYGPRRTWRDIPEAPELAASGRGQLRQGSPEELGRP